MNTLAKQKGVVLVIGLLMLLVITIVGVTAMSSTTSNERMAANNQFKTISFQAAESAIYNVARPSMLTPAFDASPTPVVTQTFNYDVDLHGSGGITVSVSANADITSCGEHIGNHGFKSGLMDRIYDVFGTGLVANSAMGERHLMRMRHLNQQKFDMAFDNTVCERIE